MQAIFFEYCISKKNWKRLKSQVGNYHSGIFRVDSVTYLTHIIRRSYSEENRICKNFAIPIYSTN